MPLSLSDQLYAERVGLSGQATVQELADLVVPRYAQCSLVGQNGNGNSVEYTIATGQVITSPVAFTAVGNGFRLDVTNARAVEITAIAAYAYETGNANTGTISRIAPVLALLKNGSLVAVSATAYQRHTTGHNDSSNTITYTDLTPSFTDVWTLESRRGSTRTNVINVSQGQFTVKAVL